MSLMSKYHFSKASLLQDVTLASFRILFFKSRRNITFWPKVDEMEVAQTGVGKHVSLQRRRSGRDEKTWRRRKERGTRGEGT